MSDWGYFPLAGPGGIAGMVGMLPMVVVWMAGWSGMNLRRTEHFAEVSKEKTKGRFFDQSAQYMARQ